MSEAPLVEEGAVDASATTQQQNLPVTYLHPGLVRAGQRIRVATLILGVLVAAGVTVWMMSTASRAWLVTGLWSMGAVAAMTLFSALIVKRVFSAAQASLPAWLGVGYLGRILIVAIALIGGRVAEAEVRVIGVALIVIILLSTLIEVWVLSRARILHVVPLDTSA